MADLALQTEQLTRRYGQRIAVNQLDLQIATGTIFGLLGPNGAGKTTTLAMALHLVRPDSGHVLINGIDVWREPLRALRQVGALIEAPSFYPYLSAHDNLLVLAQHAQLPSAEVPTRLQQLGLHERAHEPIQHFSQGMRQRLGLAAALLGDPPLLILDEPTVGLDPQGVVELRTLLRDLAAQGRTIIFSSHQLGEVQQLCDHVAVLNHGRCIAAGEVAALLGAGGRVFVRVLGDETTIEQALALVRAWRGGTKARLLDGLIDALVAAEDAAALNRYLIEHNLEVAELRPAAPSLEDFFLSATTEEPQ